MQFKREDWSRGGRLRRLFAIFGSIAGAFAIMCFVPWNLTIKRSLAVELAEPEQVRPEVSGFIKEIYVKEGDKVAPGQPLALLENRELAQQHVSNTQRLQMARASMERALGTDKPAEYKQFESQVEEYQRRQARSQKDIEGMVLRSRTGGTVLTRDLDRRLGHLLRNGEVFCEIGRLDPMEIKMALTEKQVRYVHEGQPVVLQADAYPGKTIQGKISEVHPMLMAGDLPAALSARRAGDVPTGVDAKGREIPLEHTYEARVIVQNSEGLLRPGMTGHGRIETGRRAWGRLVLQSVLDLISLDFRF